MIVDKPTFARLQDADRATGFSGELLMLAGRVHNSIKQSRLLDQCVHERESLRKARAALDNLLAILDKTAERVEEERLRWKQFQETGKWAEPKTAS
jgi:hypothetical protein